MAKNNISVIILAAGEPKYPSKLTGSKSLVEIKEVPLILHQTGVIRESLKRAEIIYVLGYEIDKILKVLPKKSKFIENEKFVDTTPTHSIELGLSLASTNNILLIDGDIVFNKYALSFPKDRSHLILDNHKLFESIKLGVNLSGDQVLSFAYSTYPKWAHIAYLTNREATFFGSLEKSGLLPHEVYDRVVDAGGEFLAWRHPQQFIKEINSHKDIKKLNV